MKELEKDVVHGLSSADVKAIADQVNNRTDGNHPQFCAKENGFIDILQNAKPNISATSVFIGRASL